MRILLVGFIIIGGGKGGDLNPSSFGEFGLKIIIIIIIYVVVEVILGLEWSSASFGRMIGIGFRIGRWRSCCR